MIVMVELFPLNDNNINNPPIIMMKVIMSSLAVDSNNITTYDKLNGPWRMHYGHDQYISDTQGYRLKSIAVLTFALVISNPLSSSMLSS